MAIFDRITDEQLQREFEHIGWFCGMCPVYLSGIDTGEPMIVERNWVPEWWFSVTEALFAAFCYFASWLDPEFEPAFPIMITGVIAGPEDRRHG
jgi:hypothetical protein